MKSTTSLEDVRGAASLCIKCSNCTYGLWPENKSLCPIYVRDRCYTYSGGGLLYLVLALLNKQIDYSQSIADLAFTCTSCVACDNNCGIIRSQKPHVNPLDIIRLLRYEVVRKGLIPEGIARKIYDEVKKKGDYGQISTLKLPGKIINDKAETVIFIECSHTKTQSKISGSVASLLAKIGSPVAIFAEKGCCGSTLYDFGFREQLEPLVKANWKKMKDLKDRKFVFTNPHCQEFIVKRYPENLPNYSSIKNQHISQLLVSAFKEGKLKSKKGDKVKVSYHDPCYLGRGLGIYDAPRELLSSLNGVKLIEMERNKENSFCCGSRALGNYFPNMSEWTARERIKEFQATRADLLITACPYCKENFQKVVPNKDKERIKDLTELVDERT
jgi:heterodisulfide reductase subunit D